MRIYLLLAMAVGASFIGSSCGGSGVGDPCVPEDEYVTSFSGFSASEVSVESRSFQCLTRVCLVNHFQGRVSCPYGQLDAQSNKCTSAEGECQPGTLDHQTSCRVPDRDGSDIADRIKVPVSPQLVSRQADDAVYCSCRCAGPDAGARYCECPSGFTCTELVDDLGLGRGQLAGSYCIRDGTEYDPQASDRAECSSGRGNCGSLLESGVGVNPPNPDIVASTDEES